MISLTDCDAIKRHLAFRIIVNAMSFENLIGECRFLKMRTIRDTLLAHKQEPGFIKASKAVDHINRNSINDLINFTALRTSSIDGNITPSELNDSLIKRRFQIVIRALLKHYVNEELASHRITNNYLAHAGNHCYETTDGDIPRVF